MRWISIARLAQVAQRLDDRQARADGRFVQVVRAALRGAPRAVARRTRRSALFAFLFGVTMWMPLASHAG